MDLPFFIAKRIVFNRQPSFSRFIIRLAAVATALSVAAIIITLSLINGFQHEVSRKVYSFWGHIRVHELQPSRSSVSEEAPVSLTDSVDQIIGSQPWLQHYHRFATKSVVLKTANNFEGILLKGVDSNFNRGAFNEQFLQQGEALQFTGEGYSSGIIISDKLASRLGLGVDSSLNLLYIRQGEDLRSRPVKVRGIYHTGIHEYDNQFVLCDLRLLQRLSLWDSSQAAGYEIFISDVEQAESHAATLYRALPQGLAATAVRHMYPNIFDWLAIQNQTKRVVITIMLAVAIVNLLTCLLILVMERTRMTAVLTAQGMARSRIARIFWYYAITIAVAGIVAGVVFALLVTGLQHYTGFIKLDEDTYYVRAMPVRIAWWEVAFVVLGTLLVCLVALRAPLWYIGRLPVVKALRFS